MSRVVIKMGILGPASGSSENIKQSKNNVISAKKVTIKRRKKEQEPS